MKFMRKISQKLLKKRLNKRVKKILSEVKRIEDSQIVTQETMNLWFGPLPNTIKKKK
jgi:hypothetical protein